MTKKEVKARKAAWSRALAEGRVVRMEGGMTLCAYPTVERAKAAVEKAGGDAEIVQVPSDNYGRWLNDSTAPQVRGHDHT